MTKTPVLFFRRGIMRHLIKYVGMIALVITSLAAVCPAYGQNFAPGVSPFFQVRRGLTIGQFAYNLALTGQALQNFPQRNNPYASAPGYFAPYMNPYMAAYSG